MSMNFHPEVLTTAQRKVLRLLGPITVQRQFYLVGETALALRFGHRRSVDLDWFTGEQIVDPIRLAQDIRDEGVLFVTGQIERGTLHGSVFSVRVSCLEYRYPLLQPLILWPELGCLVASLDDLACMKLSAAAQRGSKKDFVDIYALGLRYKPLQDMLRLFQKKYSMQDIGHVLYGLTYFDDGDRERMPNVWWNTDWRIIKKTIQGWVREIAG